MFTWACKYKKICLWAQLLICEGIFEVGGKEDKKKKKRKEKKRIKKRKKSEKKIRLDHVWTKEAKLLPHRGQINILLKSQIPTPLKIQYMLFSIEPIF